MTGGAISPPLSFAARIIDWQRSQGRHDLPWQGRRGAYAVWVSEIMLQQTQVRTVIPYYERFMAEFADVSTLAQAPLERVLEHWSGLGYYSRARNLHRCARELVERHAGIFPEEAADLEALPGIGRSTAAAIRSLAFGVPAAILDGNVKRVVARHFGIAGYPGEPAVQRRLWAIAEQELPATDAASYTQGLMDLGASHCARRRPACVACPVSSSCQARLQDRVDDIPASRPKAPVRRRHVVMLMVIHDDQVLLERRSASGIWGGLYSLPEFDITAEDYLAAQPPTNTLGEIEKWLNREGLRATRMNALERFEHRFTHQLLGVVPIGASVASQATVEGAALKAAEPGCIWLPMAKIAAAALPQPVKQLLLRVPCAVRGTG